MGLRHCVSISSAFRTRLVGSFLAAAGLLAWPLATAGVAGSSGTLPYPAAVSNSRTAAEAVLERAGAETCLRGKLTNALLGLSASCAASGERNPLCALADKAVVVTPMTLSFMDETARQLLDLSAAAALPAASASAPAPSVPAGP